MKVYSVTFFARWDFDGFDLYNSLEAAELAAKEYNDKQDECCQTDKCCFAKVQEREIK